MRENLSIIEDNMANAVEYTPREQSSKQENRFKWTLAAFLVVIIILVVLIGILSIYVDVRGRSLCTTKECLQSASALKSTMDLNYDPCDNFYEFACNKFEEVNLEYADPLDEYTNFDRITNRLNHVIEKFLHKPLSAKDPAPVKLVKDFYTACTNKTKREELGYSVMDKYLLEAGLPKVPTIFTLPQNAWDTFSFDWVKTAVAMKKIFGIDLFVNVYKKDNKIYVAGVIEDPILSPLFSEKDMDLFETFGSPEELKENFKRTVIHTVSEVLSLEPKVRNFSKILDKASDAIWNMTIEVYLAKKKVGGGKDYEIRKNEVKKIRLADLQNSTDFMLIKNSLKPLGKGQGWSSFIKTLFKEITGTKLKLTGNYTVYYYEKELPYIVTTPILMAKLPDVMLEMYAWWKAVFSMIIHTTEEFSNTLENLLYTSSRFLNILDDCRSLTEKHFNSAIRFGLLTKNFLTETKPKVEEFTESLRDTFFETIRTIDWIDDDERDVAIKKLKAMKVFVGAPDWIINETRVMDEYSTLQIRNDSHLDNLMQIVRRSMYFAYETEVEDTLHNFGTVNDVNVHYNQFTSSIYIPWSILNAPIYHLGLAPLNYGALGTIIGHEMIHGFDLNGRFYDDQLTFRNWWSRQTLTNFNEKSQCFVEQYENFTITIGSKEQKINGVKTLDENIADNGGIRIAYHALQRYLKKRGREYQLPGLVQFTSEQLFFLSYAYMWCSSGRSEDFQVRNRLAEHAPNDVRVNGVAQNTPEFSEAFDCPLGSRMNPRRKRCYIW